MNKNVAFLIPSLKNGGAERVLSNMSLNLSEDINQSIIVWNASSIDYEYKADILDISIDNKRSILANANVLFERIKNVKKLKEKHNIQTTVSLLEGPNIVNILSRNNDKVILSVHNFQSEERKGIYGKIFKVLIKSLYNKSDKVILSPAFIPQVASSAAKLFISAFWETVTTSERSAFSKATSAVMIFVVLAGYILSNI